MTSFDSEETWDKDDIVNHLIMEFDKTVMPLPNLESEPHLLISKVRKHYMECVIRILSVNYETNQRLLKKNFYLPSAIWRCAKNIEMAAAQNCMVVQLYRKYIMAEISEMKNNTKNGKLYTKLNDCLNQQPQNEKKTQTHNIRECNCQCTCGQRKRRCTTSISPEEITQKQSQFSLVVNETANGIKEICDNNINPSNFISNKMDEVLTDNKAVTPHLPSGQKMPVESHDSDELMMQLEKMFHGDPCDEDIFDGTLCKTIEPLEDPNKRTDIVQVFGDENETITEQKIQQSNTEPVTSLDDRLVSMTGMLGNHENIIIKNNNSLLQLKPEKPKRRNYPSKWLCEEYFLKIRLFEELDRLGDCNRKKLARIKTVFIELFGEDSDDEGNVVSPLEETSEFTISCKERIAPWVAKLLTPYYVKGRIRGKTLFKSLTKHLIRLIYQCSHYPSEYEVISFVSDFLHSHKLIRCEADFKQFKIDNI